MNLRDREAESVNESECEITNIETRSREMKCSSDSECYTKKKYERIGNSVWDGMEGMKVNLESV